MIEATISWLCFGTWGEDVALEVDASIEKLLWLAICDIEEKRAIARERQRGLPSEKRRAEARLVEGAVTTNWKQALEQLSLVYPNRINRYL